MPEKITIDDARYALDIFERICTQVGSGLPASPRNANGPR